MQACTSLAPDLGLLYLQEACVQFISSRLLAVPKTLDSVTHSLLLKALVSQKLHYLQSLAALITAFCDSCVRVINIFDSQWNIGYVLGTMCLRHRDKETTSPTLKKLRLSGFQLGDLEIYHPKRTL